MTTPVSQSFPQEWQHLLLDAIERRDGPKAVLLAQRCVHRYGMPALEALLQHSNATQGHDGAARAWLLPLLMPSPSHQDPPAHPSMPVEALSHPPEAKATLASPDLSSTDDQPPAPPSPVTLDDVFAPLEIAFPPLPSSGGLASTERDEPVKDPEREPQWASKPPPDLVVEQPLVAEPLQQHRFGDEPLAEDPDPEGPEPDAEEFSRLHPTVDSDQPMLAPEPPPLLVDVEAEVAAPMPTFRLEDPLTGSPPARKLRYAERRRGTPPAPISPALEHWLAWLHGSHQPRQRS